MAEATTLAARFIPAPDVVERHEVIVHAPAALVSEVARHFDLQSIGVIRTIFRLRSVVLRSAEQDWKRRGGLVEEMRSIGWGTLLDEPGRAYAAGALAQPWQSDVKFTPIPADDFRTTGLADHVKIVWTLETDPVGDGTTRFASETRVEAVDATARTKFRRYWRFFGIGIVLIRWLLLPAVRREAERRHRALRAASHK